MIQATDEEIRDFFAETIFEGIFSKEIKGSNSEYFKGHIHSIKVNGVPNNVLGSYINVPISANDIPEGPCTFKCRVKEEIRKSSSQINFSLSPKTLRFTSNTGNLRQLYSGSGTSLVNRTHRLESDEVKLLKRNLKLKNDLFVGRFIENKDGSFKIEDIRRTDFSKLILQNGKAQAAIVYHPKIEKPISGKYYEFRWILNKAIHEEYVYFFKVDESFSLKEVDARNLISRLNSSIMNYSADAGQKIVKMLDTLKNQLTASGKEIFIYELLQNANDYPVKIDGEKQSVDVEFHLTLTSLVFMHTGAAFNEENIAAICSINDKEKDSNKEAIGYKGIGFKTVFLDNDNVYLQTAGYSFRFDRQASKDIVDTPWQILPIWTPYTELSSAEKAIFKYANQDFRVKFALRPIRKETLRDIPLSYEQMFRKVFANERVILFIPNLANVRIYLQGTSTPDIVCSRSNEKWRVDNFDDTIDENITECINNDITNQEAQGGLKIPTKYYDFKTTVVSFACEIDNGSHRLKPVQDTCLYCYLPAKEAKWGLKFLMNTDMIPNGARDNIETEFDNTTNINEEIAKIAGSKFFEWIHKLCVSKQYEYNSIFDLIPNFSTIKRGREKFKELISEFQKSFEDRLKTDGIIPCNGGYALIHETILDETGLSSSGLLSDEEFMQFLGKGNVFLPDLSLRLNIKENESLVSLKIC